MQLLTAVSFELSNMNWLSYSARIKGLIRPDPLPHIQLHPQVMGHPSLVTEVDAQFIYLPSISTISTLERTPGCPSPRQLLLLAHTRDGGLTELRLPLNSLCSRVYGYFRAPRA